MYLKGYGIEYGKGTNRITLPKWDYGGDTSFTNRDWNSRLEVLRSLSEGSYPLIITDLDREDNKVITIYDKLAFEIWLKDDFDI